MPNLPIRITGINPDNTLILSDNGHTIARFNDTITWLIQPGSGVEIITAIEKKENSPNVFSSSPAPLGGSTNWRGTIVNSILVTTMYEYLIKYRKTGVAGEFLHDPIIQLNP